MADIRKAVGYVCEHAEQLRAELASEGGEVARVEQVLDALRGGLDPAAALTELDAEIRRAGDSWGVFGAASRGGLAPAVSDIPLDPNVFGPGRPIVLTFVCPLQRCDRSWSPPDSGRPEVPACHVALAPLKWDGDVT